MQHAAARHFVFLPAHLRTVLAFFNAAEEGGTMFTAGELRKEPDHSRTCDASSTLVGVILMRP